MKKYKKINKIEVLEKFCNIEIIGQWYVPKTLVAKLLGTSIYQVNKQCKKLIEEGYLESKLIEPFHDYDYESGIDYGNSLKIWITNITDKGIEKIKELGLYMPKWYEDLEMQYK